MRRDNIIKAVMQGLSLSGNTRQTLANKTFGDLGQALSKKPSWMIPLLFALVLLAICLSVLFVSFFLDSFYIIAIATACNLPFILTFCVKILPEFNLLKDRCAKAVIGGSRQDIVTESFRLEQTLTYDLLKAGGLQMFISLVACILIYGNGYRTFLPLHIITPVTMVTATFLPVCVAGALFAVLCQLGQARFVIIGVGMFAFLMLMGTFWNRYNSTIIQSGVLLISGIAAFSFGYLRLRYLFKNFITLSFCGQQMEINSEISTEVN